MYSSQQNNLNTLESLISNALNTLGKERNYALDAIRMDELRGAVELERGTIIRGMKGSTEMLDEWLGAMAAERGYFYNDWSWLQKNCHLDIQSITQKLTQRYPELAERVADKELRRIPDVADGFIRLLHLIPSRIARQFVASAYENLSYLQPSMISPQQFCACIAQYEKIHHYPFSTNKLFEQPLSGLMAQGRGRVLGAITWSDESLRRGEILEIAGLWVAPLERREGLASALIRKTAIVALRAGKQFMSVRLLHPHAAMTEVLQANGFVTDGRRSRWDSRDTKIALQLRADVINVLHSDKCPSDDVAAFTDLCGGSEIAGSLSRARRALLRLDCPRPSQSKSFTRMITELHREDQLSGDSRYVAQQMRVARLRLNGTIRSLQAQSGEIRKLLSKISLGEDERSQAIRYFADVINDASNESMPDNVSSFFSDGIPLQWKYIPKLPKHHLRLQVSEIEPSQFGQVSSLQVERRFKGLVLDTTDLSAICANINWLNLVCTDGERVTGNAIGSCVDTGLEVNQIVVDLHHRRQGSGRALVNSMIAYGILLRSKEISAIVREDNDPAIALFASCGFKAVRVLPPPQGKKRSRYQFTLSLTAQNQ